MDIEAIIEQAIDRGLPKIKAAIDEQEFTTFGKLKKSVRREGLTVKAKGYIFKLLRGAPPTAPKIADWREGSNLFDWVNKKIKPEGRKTQSVAYLIARKLAQEGSQIYRGEKEPLDLSLEKSSIDESVKINLKFARKEYIQKKLK